MSNIRTRADLDHGQLSMSCTPWNIRPDTEYFIEQREDMDKFQLKTACEQKKFVSYLMERDLFVLFEEEELFMAKLSGIEKREARG